MFGWIRTGVRRLFRNVTSGLRSPGQWLLDTFTMKSDAGVSVTGNTSAGYAPVWYAVNKIAGHVGQLPLNLHRSLERGSVKDTRNPVYRLMKTRPNRYQTAIQFKETMTAHALLWGNAPAFRCRRE